MSAGCELCGLPVGIRPFALAADGRTLQFCCEGCRGIYAMLHDIPDAPVQNESPAPTEPRKETP
ncbi:hypothetical protein [Azonexus sp.]|uniref:hypothetical protein n=1 Tax=Azonexus sp. TaxID=1872668 RepID=UPI0035B1A292